MFGRQRRTESREAIRDELSAAADRHARAVLADAMSQIDLRLAKDREERAHSDVSTQTAIESLRFAVMDKSGDVGPALAQVAEMCALVAERLEADRLERHALTEAITLLARASAAPLAAAPVDVSPRVIGGTVLASSEPANVIDLVEADRDLAGGIDVDQPVEFEVAEASVAEDDHRPVELVTAEVGDATVFEPAGYEARAYEPRAYAPIRSEPSEPEPQPEPGPSPAPESSSGSEAWRAFDEPREGRSLLSDTVDLRPRQGTRLTARRSNAPV